MIIRIPKTIQKPQIGFAELTFLLGVFLKQFYLRKSGSIQISDAVIMLSVFMLMASGHICFSRIDVPLAAFVACTFVINGAYSLVYGRKMLLASIYFLYNLTVVMGFRVFTKKEAFIRALMYVMELNLLTQLMVYFAGIGRTYGALRYQGTFNDPNQFGFFVICCLFMLYICKYSLGKRLNPIWYCIDGYLVLLSASRGMVMAFLVFLFFAVIRPALETKRPLDRFLFMMAFICCGVFILLGGKDLFSGILGTSGKKTAFIISRFKQRAGGGSLREKIYRIIVDRKMTRILTAPEYFLFGSGEGVWSRFLSMSIDDGEIHSTMIGLCYYYGILAYSFFVIWVWNCIKKVPVETIGIYLALLLEAATLINHRQPLFWMILAYGVNLRGYWETLSTQNG